MTRLVIVGLVLLTFAGSINAQECYTLNINRETMLLGLGGTFLTAGLVLSARTDPVDPTLLRRESIFFLDQFAAGFHDNVTRHLGDLTCVVASGFPVALSVIAGTRESVLTDVVMLAESMLLAQGLSRLAKGMIKRPAPFAYCADITGLDESNDDLTRSFFSGHTTTAFCGAVFAGTVFQTRHPDSPWVRPVWLIGFAAATATAVMRVTSGNHFPTDVLAGAVIGSLTGWIVPRLHRTSNHKQTITLEMSRGFGLRMQF